MVDIEAAGYLPFGDSPSDHRGLWVKIKEESLFGYSMEKVVPPTARRLTLDNPKVVKKWIDIYKTYILNHQLPQRIFKLQNQIEAGIWNAELKQEYDIIRLLRRQGIELADSKCRKLNMGEVPWSMTLQAARDNIELWTNVVSQKRGTKVSTKFISRLEKATNTPH